MKWLLLLLFPFSALGQTVIYDAMPIPATTATATPTPTPPSYLVNQGFEGTGYDNSETWNETGPGTVDEDYVTSPIVGSQSLNIVCSAQVAFTFVSYADNDDTYSFFRFRFNSSSGSVLFAAIRTSAGTAVATLTFAANGKISVTATGGTLDTTTVGMSSGTNYYIWFEYHKGTGANAVAKVGYSSDGTKPTLSAGGTNSAVSSNGTSSSQAGRLYLGTNNSSTVDEVFDHVLVSTSPIGDNP